MSALGVAPLGSRICSSSLFTVDAVDGLDLSPDPVEGRDPGWDAALAGRDSFGLVSISSASFPLILETGRDADPEAADPGRAPACDVVILEWLLAVSTFSGWALSLFLSSGSLGFSVKTSSACSMSLFSGSSIPSSSGFALARETSSRAVSLSLEVHKQAEMLTYDGIDTLIS